MLNSVGSRITNNLNHSIQLKNLLAAETDVEDDPGRGPTIALLEDSINAGFGTASGNGNATALLPARVTSALQADGILANHAHCIDRGDALAIVADARISPSGGASWSFPIGVGAEIVG